MNKLISKINLSPFFAFQLLQYELAYSIKGKRSLLFIFCPTRELAT